ncbi:MAG: glycosyltransferase [Rhodothermia bacterium]
MQTPLEIVLYCPDTHVEYDGFTPDERGLGGGKTAQIRLCEAFARLGHRVTFFANCSRSVVCSNVEYQHYSAAGRISCDLFIASTTGDKLDLSPVAQLEIKSSHRVVWAQGFLKREPLDAFPWDFLHVPSNYLRDLAEAKWAVQPSRLFVVHNGVKAEYFRDSGATTDSRDPFGIVYTGHPMKGLDHAREVLRRLRNVDSRYHLDVVGGYQLWGDDLTEIQEEPGIAFRGMLGQRDLARQLRRYTYCLALQQREEPFGIALVEAQKAGVAVIASDVGAYSELVRDGFNGFLVGPEAGTEASYQEAFDRILYLAKEPDVVRTISRRASESPLDWDTLARSWLAHRSAALSDSSEKGGANRSESTAFVCPKCHARLLELPDGCHCEACGRFSRKVGGISSFQDRSGGYSELGKERFYRLAGRAASSPWRQAVAKELGGESPFLSEYILDDGRGDLSLLLDLDEEARVLDLGAGYGTVAAGFVDRCNVAAFDNDFLRLAFCAERFSQEGQAIELVHGEGNHLPFRDEMFDAVLLIGVLEWVGVSESPETPDQLQRRFLSEVGRVLKPGGTVLIGIENAIGFEYLLGMPDDHTQITHITHLPEDEADERSRCLKGVPYRVRTHSRAGYDRLLGSSGFKEVRYFWAYPDYRLWSTIIPLSSNGPADYFLRRLPQLETAEFQNQELTALRRAAATTGAMADFAGCYFILAERA